ncbi:LytR/AlgR family response regulator transcription factor [Saccharicrinis sp. FJH62]|uniref:LytR/AlgR family response regulator transcription factor n=1 Tax=Saccharicrinis sp. FJH62 TaxID=3344657 RepID=UPI0035D430CE
MNTKTYSCIIVDDEPAAIQRLKELVSDFPSTFRITGTTQNAVEAIDLINSLEPDLIFLDIQMPEITGFDLIKALHKIPLIVFCTAYDQYALKAFETNSIDYLLKPVKKERLEQTVKKLNSLTSQPDRNELMKLLEQISAVSPKKELTSITVRQNNKIQFYRLSDIAYFKAADKYVSLYLKNGEEKIIEKSLAQLGQDLPENFLRVHRSVIINKNFVQEVQVHFNSRYAIIMNDHPKTKIISGRSYLAGIKKWMDY